MENCETIELGLALLNWARTKFYLRCIDIFFVHLPLVLYLQEEESHILLVTGGFCRILWLGKKTISLLLLTTLTKGDGIYLMKTVVSNVKKRSVTMPPWNQILFSLKNKCHNEKGTRL